MEGTHTSSPERTGRPPMNSTQTYPRTGEEPWVAGGAHSRRTRS